MAYELLFVFSFMGIHSVCSLGESDTHLYPTPSVLPCKHMKCPPGFSSFCPQNGRSRCLPCVEGTFSEHHSRRKVCRPCSSCRDNEFEFQPCTPTSNRICKECSRCAPGFWEVKSCEKTRDTVCEKCPHNGKGYMSYANIACNEGEVEDHYQSKEKGKLKSTMTIIDVENPWTDDKKELKRHDKFTVDEQHVKKTASLPGRPSVNPAPSSLFKTKVNDASSPMKFSSHSVAFVSLSVEASSMSIAEVRESIGLSLIPTMPSEYESPPPKPLRTKPTTKTDFDTNTEEPSSYEMQGDDGNYPRHATRRSIDQNSTTMMISLKPRGTSSVSPSEHVETANMIDLKALEVAGEHSTDFSRRYTSSGTALEHGGEMPVPGIRNRSRSKSSPSWLWRVIAVATGVGIVLAVIGVGFRRRQFRETKGCFLQCPRPTCRRPRCPASSDCCDGSVSSVPGEFEEQNQGNPVNHGVSVNVDIEHQSDESTTSNNTTLHTFLPSEQTVVVADVHHKTVFDLFNIGGQGSYPKCITEVQTTLNSSGGELSATDSNISVIVDSGTVPEGIEQPFFFRVVYDETSLLSDFPETPDRTLISPVFQCGPDGINLLKPVEIIVPHCLYLDEVKKESISVYRCGSFSDGLLKWEKVPSASEKNCQSKAWFTVKKDSIHIKTKTFSFWSIFACGGPKRKRATVFYNKPNSELDTICFRFYIYSDNEDSKKRVRTKDRELFPDSKQANEIPFKMYNDTKDVIVKLTDLEEGWEMDKTPSTQTYTYETAYRNGFRTYTSCEFTVKPQAASQSVDVFSCNLKFQQEEHTPEHTIYLIGFTPRQTIRRFSVESHSSASETPSNNTSATGTGSRISVVQEEDETIDGQENGSSPDSSAKVPEVSSHCFPSLGSDNEPVTQSHCHCISQFVGGNWKNVLRYLDMEEVPSIENVDKDYKHEPVAEKCYQGLLAWMRSRGTQRATTKKLCDALRLAGCSEALETLLKEGVSCDSPAPTPESNADQGICV